MSTNPVRLDPHDYGHEDSLGFLISKLKGLMMQALEAGLADLDITAAQGVILIRLGREPVSTAAALCRHSGYDTGSMTRMIDRLEDKGFIARERSTEDRRVINLKMTESGQVIRAEVLKRACEMMEPRLEGFSVDEFVLLKSLLRRVLDNAVRLAPSEQDGGGE
ncbi:MarR family transcriptional regulator [Uliginosibacterium sp. H3]|uniref:MarR family transcriptional regulator n=1 Tax=Uliginosibacterium silvisoli TaxID=3114758 RepID=A0ABU6K0R2_9RHOO|nr:MarR family transcriptional regulator [Uliginosibacterium sp. H3]